ncbi:AGAP007273-PA-like protein [Anopheles sinensis]|uniref:AGAP007273-PA-like protein n=1 Tax=Anopheles sinensis TaxID=74873 RepID=A0A084VQT7_ANOSI|nr:AGAP007273-PA-like protein [Anopheles sinensis]
MEKMNQLPIVTFCVLALVQYTSAEPRPEFALTATVPGTSRVSVAASAADTAIADINVSVQNYVITSELQLLTDVATIVADIANQYQPLAEAITDAITALASDTSGDIDGAFAVALGAVADAISFADNTLPGLEAPLVPLVGNALPDKFLDSFQHIGKALEKLETSLTELKAAANSAVAEAGSSGLTATIVSRTVTRALVGDLVYALNLLKATVPLLEYVVSSTMENIGLADAFMLELDQKVDDTIGESSTLQLEVETITQPLGDYIANTLNTIDTDLGTLATTFAGLTNLASAAELGAVLDNFKDNLVLLSMADPSIANVLAELKKALTDAYDVVDPLYFIYESPLVNALMTTLVGNGNYAQYCFYKYKDYFFLLLDWIAYAASECIQEEAPRLEYYQDTVKLMLDILFYDFEDIADDLEVCNKINDATNLQECTSKFAEIYDALEGSFGNKITLGYQSLQHEIAASGNRLKICISLSQSALSNDEVPKLLEDINSCANDGPTGENE